MKKVIALLVALIAVIGTLSVGTFAYFADIETSTNNQIAAGTLDLKIGATGAEADVNYNFLTGITAKKPGDSDGTKYASLKFAGDVTDNHLLFTITSITNAAGTTTDAESDADLGNDPSDDGELGGLIKVTFWLDLDDNGWDAGDKWFDEDDTIHTVVAEAGPANVSDLISAFQQGPFTYPGVDTDLSGGTARKFYVYWEFPEGGATDNKGQGDTVTFSLKFTVKQGDAP